MAFTPEDGTGIPGANSYGTSAEAFDYFFDRGVTEWTEDAEATAQESALIEAAQYEDATYSWVGQRNTQEQGLGWPRSGGVDGDGFPIASDVVPEAIKEAQFELALIVLTTPLLPPEPRGGAVTSLKQKVDVIEEETDWSESAPAGTTYPLVDRILAGYVDGGAGSISAKVRRT